MRLTCAAAAVMIDDMQDERLRLLALWHGLRRDVEALLEPLLAHGPVAVSRVAGHLAEVELTVAREQAAFQAFRTACAAQAPVGPVELDRPHDDLARGRALVAPPAGWTADREHDATVIQLPERSRQT